jgi:hypothetical protein
MARTYNSIFAATKGMSGSIGKQIVFRNRAGKTFASKFPDMSNVVFTENQKREQSKMAAAVGFARDIIYDPIKKANYKAAPGKSVYQTAISDYLKSH